VTIAPVVGIVGVRRGPQHHDPAHRVADEVDGPAGFPGGGGPELVGEPGGGDVDALPGVLRSVAPPGPVRVDPRVGEPRHAPLRVAEVLGVEDPPVRSAAQAREEHHPVRPGRHREAGALGTRAAGDAQTTPPAAGPRLVGHHDVVDGTPPTGSDERRSRGRVVKQAQRVDVATVAARSPVQAAIRRPVAVPPGREHGERLTGADDVATAHRRRGERPVARQHAVGVRHAHPPDAGDHAGERHRPAGRRPDHLARAGIEVDPAVAGPEGCPGRVEGAQHPAGDGPPVPHGSAATGRAGMGVVERRRRPVEPGLDRLVEAVGGGRGAGVGGGGRRRSAGCRDERRGEHQHGEHAAPQVHGPSGPRAGS
jgi:hypothetical protein